MPAFGDNLSDEDFLSLVYLNILGRPADQDGYNFWLAVLKSGAMSREQLIVEFTESDEFKADVDDEGQRPAEGSGCDRQRHGC